MDQHPVWNAYKPDIHFEVIYYSKGIKMKTQTLIYKDTARKLKALAHPIRLKIMQELMKGECCVGEMQKCLSISQPNVSQHLKTLKDAGLIECRRESNKICYRVSNASIKRFLKNILREEL